MIKTTLLFNKLCGFLAITLLSAAAAVAQCPAGITVNNTAGQCGATVSYTMGGGGGPVGQSANGVVNGSATNGLTGWTVVNGGDGWIASGGYFISSYVTGSMSQVIDLTTMGMSDTYMDTQPAITVSEDYIGWLVNYADTYSLTVQLRGEGDNVIATYATGNITTAVNVQTASHVFTGYGTGVRKVYISHTGVSTEFWAGQYGAAITNVQCLVAVPAVTSVQTGGLASGSVFPIGTTTNTFDITQNGTTTSCSFNVVVNDTEAPVAHAQAMVMAQLGADGTVTVAAADVNNGSTDNCTNSTLTYSLNTGTFTCDNLGENTVTLTVSDGTNSSTATGIVHVTDATAPVVTLQDATVALGADGTAAITRADIDNGSADNCSIAGFVISQTAFDCAAIGTHALTVTATDASGNIATGTVNVTVTDTIAPVAVTNDITVQLTPDATVTVTATAIGGASTDNCSIATYTLDQFTFTCDNIGANTVTLTIIDASGNTSTGTATVTVEDSHNYCDAAGLSSNFTNTLQLYPNPVSTTLTVNAAGYTLDKMEVYDINARLLKTFDAAQATGLFTADVSALSPGIYLVKTYSGKSTAVKKVVKQ